MSAFCPAATDDSGREIPRVLFYFSVAGDYDTNVPGQGQVLVEGG